MLHWHMNDQWHTTDGDWRRPMTDYQLLQMMLQTFSNRLWPTVTKQHLPLVLVRPSQLPGGEPTTCWLQETDKEYWRILMDTDDQQPFSAISFGGWQTPQSSVSKNTNEYWWRTPISAISFQLMSSCVALHWRGQFSQSYLNLKYLSFADVFKLSAVDIIWGQLVENFLI